MNWVAIADYHRHTLPWWENGDALGIVAVLLAPVLVVCVLNFIRRRNRFRGSQNLCRNCGYSLRGNVSGVCPECGTPTK